MTVKEIFSFLNSISPIETACDFDNVGLLIGDPNASVSRVMISLDCTVEAIKTAEEKGCELIVTHHPVIFDPLKRIIAGSVTYELVKKGISVISMHTNLDTANGGVNDALCNALGFSNFEKIVASDGFILNKATLQNGVSASTLAKSIKEKLGGTVKFTCPDVTVKRLLICSGSGASYLCEVKNLGCDCLITADVKHNVFIDSSFQSIPLFDAGHFETEDVVTETLKTTLGNAFPTTEFFVCHQSTVYTV